MTLLKAFAKIHIIQIWLAVNNNPHTHMWWCAPLWTEAVERPRGKQSLQLRLQVVTGPFRADAAVTLGMLVVIFASAVGGM